MAKGSSGRIVIEVEVELKNRLYSILAAQGMTLKDWFIKSAEDHMDEYEQPLLIPKIKNESKDHLQK